MRQAVHASLAGKKEFLVVKMRCSLSVFLLSAFCSNLSGTGTEQEVIRSLKNNQINFLSCLFADIGGTLKEIVISPLEFEAAFENGLFIDGSSIAGYTAINKSDLLLRIEPQTVSFEVWDSPYGHTAQVMCAVCTQDGKPYLHSPRESLKNTVERARAMGFAVQCGVELEFFLMNEDGELADCDGYCSVAVDAGVRAFRELVLTALVNAHTDPEKIHHEVAHGQFEVVLKYADPITICDNVLKAKTIIDLCAKACGYRALFMPKPFAGMNGSGMHMHISLRDINNDCNAFYDAYDSDYLSAVARSFIGNNLVFIDQCTVAFNATFNSFERLVLGFEAPVYLCWGKRNRSGAIRIPDVNEARLKETNGAAMRAEFRFPDASCNPYLALKAIIEMGLDGIEAHVTAPACMETNLYHSTQEERDFYHIRNLPQSLEEALYLFENSTYAKKIFGEELHARYADFVEKRLAEKDFNF